MLNTLSKLYSYFWLFILWFIIGCSANSASLVATPTIAILPPPVIDDESIVQLPPTPKVVLLNDDGSVSELEPSVAPVIAVPTAALVTSNDGMPLPAVTVLETAVPTQSATDIPTMTPTNAPTSTVTLTPTATHTPIPTFTPPALAGTSPNEHYWFYRPIVEGSTNWTDKVYPYGSTRGGELRPHHGVEFNVPSGTDVYAVASGTVVHAGDDKTQKFGPEFNFYGNLVVIQHDTKYRGQNVYTLYAHLSVPLVAQGQRVEARQVIAQSGGTGVADGSHLHFEVRVGANNYASTRNPRLWIYPFDGFGTVAGTIKFRNGAYAEAAPITLTRLDAKSRYYGSTSYEGNTVQRDNQWQENFVIDDVVEGYYQIVVETGTKKIKEELWVHAYNTSFVEIVID